jgi:hypothetical protein
MREWYRAPTMDPAPKQASGRWLGSPEKRARLEATAQQMRERNRAAQAAVAAAAVGADLIIDPVSKQRLARASAITGKSMSQLVSEAIAIYLRDLK